MFERYTERARRVLFFSRYESSQFGSLVIETEHVLLGLVREAAGVVRTILSTPPASIDTIKAEAARRMQQREKISHSVEIPFSAETKRVLLYSAEEADRLLHHYIGAEHILLGLLREDGAVAASILHAQGLQLEDVRARMVELLKEPENAEPASSRNVYTTEVHVRQRDVQLKEYIEQIAQRVAQLAISESVPERQELAKQIQIALDALRDRLD